MPAEKKGQRRGRKKLVECMGERNVGEEGMEGGGDKGGRKSGRCKKKFFPPFSFLMKWSPGRWNLILREIV